MYLWEESGRGAAIAVAVVLLTIGIRLVHARVRRRDDELRSGRLEPISEPNNAKFDIIAVHGLGANPVYTWTHANPANSVKGIQELNSTEQGHVNCSTRICLLEDLLSKDFPEARILSFQYNSRWLTDAPIKTTEEIGKTLLEEIKETQSRRPLPIIFIGHSLGGIVIKQALRRNDSKEIINNTSGIIFLGTPHNGSHGATYGNLIAHLTCFLGSDMTILMSLKRHAKELSNLQESFQSSVRMNERGDLRFPIISFYETKSTYIFGWLSIGQVVLRDSAVVHASEEFGIDTDHSGLNKCTGPNDQFYVQLKRKINNLKEPSLLERADTLLNKHYDEKRLNIVRLSGKILKMNQCYIDLAIVEHIGNDSHKNEEDNADSKYSLSAQQKIETPGKKVQVELSRIFDTREADSKSLNPRRILIRGQAGVGKTTLSKKIIHDFIRNKESALHSSWTKLFDRLLWVPLRNLQNWSRASYNFEDLFYDEYFSQEHNGSDLAKELWRGIDLDKKTLFVLDGLDEISHKLHDNDEMFPFLVELLNKPNVIITSRPHANRPAKVHEFDLELETIGFYPEQVEAYLEKDPVIKKCAKKVQSFLQGHRMIQELVRIPILLDALCYTWNDNFNSDTAPDTMTYIYNAIMSKLLRKDFVRLNKGTKDKANKATEAEISNFLRDEINLVEFLAFNGLYSNIIDFTSAHRNDIVKNLHPQPQQGDILDDKLTNISFLRTSDPSSTLENKNHHFIHLTFQEYFAAKHFVHQWKTDKKLKCAFEKQPDQEIDPARFLKQQKYSARYGVFWRFVAGILASEENGDVQRFFKEVEEEPLDLLGPDHQQLIMHCLSEVPRDKELPCRSNLERDLSEWLLFELEFGKSDRLAGQNEFPEEGFNIALQKGSDEMKRSILRVVSRKSLIPPSIVEKWASLLGHRDVSLQKAANYVLSKHPGLPVNILENVVAFLKDQDRRVRQAAIAVLGSQSSLPTGILETVAAQLEHANWKFKQAAIEALRKKSALPVEILKAVAICLEDKQWEVQYAAIQALRSEPDFHDRILEVLAARLKDDDWTVRQAAIEALRTQSALDKQSTLPHNILEAVAECLEDKEWDVQYAAIQALCSKPTFYGRILKALAARLKNEDWTVRRAATEALKTQLPLPDESLGDVAAHLKDEDKTVRQAAIIALSTQLELPGQILDNLATYLKDDDWTVRRAAIEALDKQSTLPHDILEDVAECLEDKEWDVQYAAIQALCSKPTFYGRILKALAARLKNEDWTVRRAATEALKTQLPLPDESLGDVAAHLKDEDKTVRQIAIIALSTQLELPGQILDNLATYLKDDDWTVRRAAIEALDKQSTLPHDILEDVAECLEDKEWDVQYAAIQALRSKPTFYGRILKALATRLKDDDWTVRQAAIEVLRTQSPLPHHILEDVTECLDDKQWEVQYAAIQTLDTPSSLPDHILKAVERCLEYWDGTALRAAIEALRTQSALPHDKVARCLKDKEWDVQYAAIQALRSKPTFYGRILKALAARLKDDDWTVRQAAIEALRTQSALDKQSTLPHNILEAVAECLEDKEWDVQYAAIQALCSKPTFYGRIIKTLAARLDDEKEDVQYAAIQALRTQSFVKIRQYVAKQLGGKKWDAQQDRETSLRGQENYCQNLEGLHIATFSRILLRLRFHLQLTWYIKDDFSYANEAADVSKFSISDPKGYVETIVNARPEKYPSIHSP